MSNLKISGKVVHMAGAWGPAVPAAGIGLTLTQRHTDNSTTEIWSGTTDENGNYSGTTAEWRRTIRIGTPPLQHDGPDPLDVLNLRCSLHDRQSNRRTEQSFAWTSDLLPSPPMAVPWAPRGAYKGSLNGVDYYSLERFAQAVKTALESPNDMRLTVAFESQSTARGLRDAINGIAAFMATASQTAPSPPGPSLANRQFGTPVQGRPLAVRSGSTPAVAGAGAPAGAVSSVDILVGILAVVFAVPRAAAAVLQALIAIVLMVITVAVAALTIASPSGAGGASTCIAVLLQLARVLAEMSIGIQFISEAVPRYMAAQTDKGARRAAEDLAKLCLALGVALYRMVKLADSQSAAPQIWLASLQRAGDKLRATLQQGREEAEVVIEALR